MFYVYTGAMETKHKTTKQKESKMTLTKKTPISSEQWDELEAQGINPEDMNFRKKGIRANKNITHATAEQQVLYAEAEGLTRDIGTFTHPETGKLMKTGVYCHAVAGQD